jgi:hypothetical protein
LSQAIINHQTLKEPTFSWVHISINSTNSCCLFEQKPRRNLKKTQDAALPLCDETFGGLRGKIKNQLYQKSQEPLKPIFRKTQLTDNKSYAMYYINLHFQIEVTIIFHSYHILNCLANINNKI